MFYSKARWPAARRSRPTTNSPLASVARLAALEAEIARLRAELATTRGEDGDPPARGAVRQRGGGGIAGAKKGRAAGFKANPVVVARHRPRQPRAPVPGRRREVPDRIVVHAPTACGGCGAALPAAAGRSAPSDRAAPGPGRGCRAPGTGAALPGLRLGRPGRPTRPGRARGPHRRFGWSVAAWRRRCGRCAGCRCGSCSGCPRTSSGCGCRSAP